MRKFKRTPLEENEHLIYVLRGEIIVDPRDPKQIGVVEEALDHLREYGIGVVEKIYVEKEIPD